MKGPAISDEELEEYRRQKQDYFIKIAAMQDAFKNAGWEVAITPVQGAENIPDEVMCNKKGHGTRLYLFIAGARLIPWVVTEAPPSNSQFKPLNLGDPDFSNQLVSAAKKMAKW